MSPAAVQTLRHILAVQDSATAALQHYCPVSLEVRRLPSQDHPASDILTALELEKHEADRIAMRHIQLQCQNVTLSEAWNYFIPDRLSPSAHHLLHDSHTPFGRAVGESFFRRIPLEERLTGLPDGTVLENRALLRRRSDNSPIAFVLERYSQNAVLIVSDRR